MELIRRGPVFDVFRDGVWCIKRVSSASPADRLAALAVTYCDSNETNIFVTRGFGWEDAREDMPTTAHYEALLAAEQHVVERVAGEWNHPGARIEGGALLMPWCDGRSFASLSRDEQRRSFPRMLPALWRALAVCPHGDLKPDALVIEDGGWFRIFDPGVRTAGPGHRRSCPGGLDRHSALMTTNAAHYPLLVPEHGPKAPVRRASLPLSTYLREDAQPRWMLAEAREPTGSPGAPSAADVLALGVIYFAVLTGAPLAAELSVEEPLWCQFWSDSSRRRHVDPCTPVLVALDDGVLERALAYAGAARAEIALCARLVRQGLEADGLAGLVQDALRALG